MNILLASSEVHPFSKTGGLADMVGSLARALVAAGHEARVITPLYRGIREKFPQIRHEDYYLNVPMGDRWIRGEVWSTELEGGSKVYFIEQPEFYDRAGIYH